MRSVTPGLGHGGNRIAAADDRDPVHLGHGLRDLDRAARERVDLEDAHRAVPRDGLRPRDDPAVGRDRLRPDVEPHAVADRRIADVERLGRDARLELRCDDVIDRQLEAQVPRPGLLLDLPRRVEQILLDERLPDRQPARLEERVRHRAADEQRVHPRHEVLDDLELVRHFRAAQHGDERPIRLLQDPAEILDFGRHQQARRLSL